MSVFLERGLCVMELKNHKKIIAGGLLAAVFAALLAVYFWPTPKDVPINAGYIIDKNKDIGLKDLLKVIGKTDFSDAEINQYFSKGVINDYTICFFKSLQWRFRSSTDLDSHYDEVCGYLSSRRPPVRNADALCRLYKRFTESEMALEKAMKSWGSPRNATEAMAFLKKEQEYRRKFFGPDVADALFRAEIKSQEYSIRRSAIVNNSTLYGDAKMLMITDLNREMWGREAGEIDKATIKSEPYNKYREKLVIYNRDVAEMTPAVRDEFIRKTRKEFFSEEVVKKFEELDAEKEIDKQKLALYYQREKEILGDPSITEKDREQAIKSLQYELFGKEGAEAFKRIEAMRKTDGS
jgi:lipase chaperone LimK